MFECSACVLRCMRAIAGDAFPTATAARRSARIAATPRFAPRTVHRHASTATGQETYLNDAQRRHQSQDTAIEALSKEPPLSKQDERALKKELEYLTDPLKLADHIRYTLRCDKPEKALELCRMASRKTQCIVSWNHVINWHMQKGRYNDATKIYNEMKKRAQYPDSYTYMLLLRSLAGSSSHHRTPEAKADNVTRAVSIYNSMSSPTSRVQPSVMHTNAALRVCSFSYDMDAFWGIASKIPEAGPGSADHITYTTILTAIRHEAMSKNLTTLDQSQVDAIRRKAMFDGRKVWRDVIIKWRGGQIQIDEELVCSMARVLLISPDIEDWDAVLSLIYQTMQIERVIPQIGSPDRNAGHVPQPAAQAEILEMEAQKEEEDEDGYTDTPAAKTFKAVKPFPKDKKLPNRPSTLAYVKPGNDTLSSLIEACSLMRVPKAAMAYWNLLTSDLINLKVDLPNFHALLQLLARNRASGRVAKLLTEDLPRAGVEPNTITFTMAMAACVRDNKNHGVLDHARTVVDVMETKLPNPHVNVLESYLNLALTSDNGDKIVGVIDRLDPIVHSMRSRLSYSGEQNESAAQLLKERETAVGFMQRMVGVMDTLMDRKLVPSEQFSFWHGRRKLLTNFIERFRGRVEKQQRKHDAGKDESYKRPQRVSNVMKARERSGNASPISEHAAGMDRSSPELYRFRMKRAKPGKTQRAERREKIEAERRENVEAEKLANRSDGEVFG